MTPKWAGRGYRARPVMNVTPLVDVVLVLLIIFMVVIPALQQGVNIELPGILNADDKKEASGGQPFTLSVSKEGEIFFEEDKVAWKDLEATLRAAAKREPGKRIVLRGDKGAEYGDVRRLYHTAQQVGFPGVSLKVNHRIDESDGAQGNATTAPAVQPH
jgi:biopolymer transport protein TolR